MDLAGALVLYLQREGSILRSLNKSRALTGKSPPPGCVVTFGRHLANVSPLTIRRVKPTGSFQSIESCFLESDRAHIWFEHH